MEKRLTIGDVARAAGVSKQTVSRVLNQRGEISPQTRERILKVIDDLGYRPNAAARSLHSGRTSTIGLVIPDITNVFFVDIGQGVQGAAREQKYHVLLYDTSDNPEVEEESLRLLHERRADGIIICSSRLSDQRLAQILEGVGPVVLVNRWVEGLDVTQIGADYVRGMYMATRHLADLGHRRIAAITLSTETANSQAKLKGYLLGMERAGLPVSPDLIVRTESSVKGGINAGIELLSREERPTAVVAYGDPVALGVMHSYHKQGLSIPGDLAIVGFGGSEVAEISNPPLSTVFIPNYEMGRQAVELLARRIEHEDTPTNVIRTEPRLLVRSSSAPRTDLARPTTLSSPPEFTQPTAG